VYLLRTPFLARMSGEWVGKTIADLLKYCTMCLERPLSRAASPVVNQSRVEGALPEGMCEYRALLCTCKACPVVSDACGVRLLEKRGGKSGEWVAPGA